MGTSSPACMLGRRRGYDDAQRIPRAAEGQQHTELPNEPLVMDGRLVMPAELQRVHRAVLDGVGITEDMRAVVQRRWPELVAKLPPRSG